jgi:hypothetical protein
MAENFVLVHGAIGGGGGSLPPARRRTARRPGGPGARAARGTGRGAATGQDNDPGAAQRAISVWSASAGSARAASAHRPTAAADRPDGVPAASARPSAIRMSLSIRRSENPESNRGYLDHVVGARAAAEPLGDQRVVAGHHAGVWFGGQLADPVEGQPPGLAQRAQIVELDLLGGVGELAAAAQRAAPPAVEKPVSMTTVLAALRAARSGSMIVVYGCWPARSVKARWRMALSPVTAPVLTL